MVGHPDNRDEVGAKGTSAIRMICLTISAIWYTLSCTGLRCCGVGFGPARTHASVHSVIWLYTVSVHQRCCEVACGSPSSSSVQL